MFGLNTQIGRARSIFLAEWPIVKLARYLNDNPVSFGFKCSEPANCPSFPPEKNKQTSFEAQNQPQNKELMHSKKLRYLDEDTNLDILEAVRVPACAALTARFVHPLHHSLSAKETIVNWIILD